jgi:hypothetical protein
MGCPVCKRLERTFEGWTTECLRARSSLYCQFSSRFAAYDNVEMERARSELRMHQSECLLAIAKAARLPLASKIRDCAISPDSARRSASSRPVRISLKLA